MDDAAFGRHAREHGPAAGSTNVSSPVWLKPCASLDRGNQGAQGALLPGRPRRRVRARWRVHLVSTARSRSSAAAARRKSKKPVAIVSYDEKPRSAPAVALDARPPVKLRAGSRYKRLHAQPVGRGSICSPARSTLVGSATAAASSSLSRLPRAAYPAKHRKIKRYRATIPHISGRRPGSTPGRECSLPSAPDTTALARPVELLLSVRPSFRRRPCR